VTPRLQAQNPGAQQDAEAAREKLLKAADQLDNIQANSEATKTSVDGMKTDVAKLQGDVTKLQSDNAALRQQLTNLQTALDQFKSEQIKARQTLIDNVAGMIAGVGKGSGTAKPGKKKKESPVSEATTETSVQAKTPVAPPNTPSLNPPPDTASTSPATAATGDNTPAPVKPRKGYYHIVASGETLTLICAAYRENGVNVTVSEIRKANGLTEKSVLKAGQKLFIPKPGT
jgi:regulator of replication initiation timing